ncbi:hypothetical protein B566_EDAN006040 [Ephemera danica]|nr:hypothetical protein B566_EDAN006040 [Ephemera danica]
MKTLVAFSLLVAAVLAEPQVFYSGVVPSAYYGGVYPYAAGVVSPYAYTAGVPAVTYPVQDTSRGKPQTVQDTPALAKSAFAAEYAATVSRNTGAVAIPVHTIHKRQAVLLPAKTPASTTPLVYSAPVVHTPYVNTYSAYPYGAYPYSYVY